MTGEPADRPGQRAVRGLDRERAGFLGEHPVRGEAPAPHPAYLTFWLARSRAAPVTSAATSAGSRTSALTAPYTSAKWGKSRNSKNARSSGSVRGIPLPAGYRRASSSTVGTDADPTRCRCSSALGGSSTKESTGPTLARGQQGSAGTYGVFAAAAALAAAFSPCL